MRFSARLSVHVQYLRPRGTLLDLFSPVDDRCRLPDPLTVFCDMFAAVSS